MNATKIELKWALIFTVVGLLWMWLEKAVGLHDRYIDQHMYWTNLFAIPAILMMYLALKEKKQKFYGGEMSFWSGILSGVQLSVFVALLSPLSQYITSYWITPEFFPNAIKRSVEIGYFPDKLTAQSHFNYANYAMQGMFGAFLMGLVTTVVIVLFLRKKK